MSEAWGRTVRLNPIPIRSRTKTRWSHYGAGVFSVWGQDEYHDFSGPDQVARVAESLARGPDLVLAAGLLATAAFVRTNVRPARLFFDLDNIEHMILWRTITAPPFWPGKLLYATHLPALFRAERRAAKLADATFVCSEPDRRYLRRLGMGRKIEVVPNGLPVPATPAPPAPQPTVLYLGTYGYKPNRDAADRLVQQIWPLIRDRVPGARLLIAGKGSEQLASFRSAPPDVTFTGYVEDLDALYAMSRVVACPIMVGAGTRLKLVEAASYGRPMVSTRVGAEGLDFEADRELLLRDDDAGFAEACAMLLRDDVACVRLGSAARAKMMALYGAGEIGSRITRMMGSGARSG